MNQTASTARSRLSHITRLLAWFAAVDPNRLATCPRDDVVRVRNIGLSMVMSFLFLSILTNLALYIALGGVTALTLALGLLIAGAVILFDQSVVFGHWHALGQRLAVRRGFDPAPARTVDVIGGVGVLLFRAVLSFVLSYTLASYVDLALWETDILRQMHETNLAQNSAVVAAATNRVDGEISRISEQVAKIDQLSQDVFSAAQNRDKVLGQDRSTLTVEVRDFDERLNRMRDQLLCVQMNVAAEVHGIEDCNGVKRDKGRGSRYSGFVAQTGKLAAEIKLIETRRSEARNALSKVDARFGQAATSVQPRLIVLKAERASLELQRDNMVNSRESRLAALVETDPQYVPMVDGLIARQEAFAQLMKSSAQVHVVSLGVTAIVMMIEMAGFLAAMIQQRPSIYALRAMTELEIEAANRIGFAEDALAEASLTTSTAQERAATVKERLAEHRRTRETAGQTRKWFDRILEDDLNSKSGPA